MEIIKSQNPKTTNQSKTQTNSKRVLYVKKNSYFALIKIMPKIFLLNEFQHIKLKKLFRQCLDVKRKFYPTSRILKLTEHTKSITAVCFSTCGKFFATASLDGHVIIYEIDPLNQLRHGDIYYKVSISVPISSICYSKIKNYFAIITLNGSLSVYNFNSLDRENFGTKLFQLEQFCRSYSIHFSADSELIASANDSGRIKIIGTNPDKIDSFGKEIINKVYHEGAVLSVKFSNYSSNNYIASGGQDGITKLISYNESHQINKFREIIFKFTDSGSIWSVSFSPNDHFLATGSSSNRVCVYGVNELDKVNYGKLIIKLSGHTWSVSSVAFSACSNLLATGSEDRSINIYNIYYRSEKIQFKTDKYMKKLTRSHNKAITCIDFSPNGYYFGSGSVDTTCAVYI